LIGIKHQNPILLQTNPKPLSLYLSNAHHFEKEKKIKGEKNWQFTLLEWTTTCAKLDLLTFSSNNVNTYVWTQIARNKLYTHTSLKNTKFTSNSTIEFSNFYCHTKCQKLSSNSYGQHQSHTMKHAWRTYNVSNAKCD
jgi:hypothetical protein